MLCVITRHCETPNEKDQGDVNSTIQPSSSWNHFPSRPVISDSNPNVVTAPADLSKVRVIVQARARAPWRLNHPPSTIGKTKSTLIYGRRRQGHRVTLMSIAQENTVSPTSVHPTHTAAVYSLFVDFHCRGRIWCERSRAAATVCFKNVEFLNPRQDWMPRRHIHTSCQTQLESKSTSTSAHSHPQRNLCDMLKRARAGPS